MAKQQYVHIFKRRRIGKTDYRARRGLILGRKPFLTVRISNKYIYGQVLRPAAGGDLTICSCSSRSLAKDYEWKGSSKNLPSAYLTGYVLGKKAKEKEIDQAVLYTGVGRFVHGSRIASFLQGAKDGGLELEFDEEILPENKRLKGNHVSDYASKLKSENLELYRKQFSGIMSRGFDLQNLSKHFDETKSAIDAKGKS